MPDQIEIAARTVLSHPWGSGPWTAHMHHKYDAACAVCRGDVRAILTVAASADGAVPVDLAAARQRINRAHTELGDVCAQGPSRRFRMHIPADPERDTDLIISAALNDADLLAGEAAQLRAEVARLRAGEADTPGDEGAELTPAQWIRRWNDATPEERLKVAEAGRANAKAAYRCFLMDHEGRLADAEEVERLRAAVARVREFAEQISQGRSRVVSRDFLTPALIRLLDGAGAVPEEQTGGDGGGAEPLSTFATGGIVTPLVIGEDDPPASRTFTRFTHADRERAREYLNRAASAFFAGDERNQHAGTEEQTGGQP